MSVSASSTRVGLRISVLTSFLLVLAPAAHGAPPTKEECVEAHGKGQDAREAGQFAQAGTLFLTCAQATCPALVQSDCARFADEIDRLQPTLTFAARDSALHDLPDTSVFVDGTLVTSRLGEGKAYEVDPGRHEVRFVHAGKETVLHVVVNQGEKGRGIVGAFALSPPPPSPTLPRAPAPVPANAPTATAAPAPGATEDKRPAGSLVVAGLGAAVAVAGGVLVGVGLSKIPAPCSLRTAQCAAAPKDPVFEQASSGVRLANLGGIVGGVGLLTLTGAMIGYFAQPLRPAERTTAGLLPWFGPEGAGLSFSGSL